MTVAEFIARLSEFPADMPVRICADMGYIVSDDPNYGVEPAVPFGSIEGEAEAVPTLFIDIN